MAWIRTKCTIVDKPIISILCLGGAGSNAGTNIHAEFIKRKYDKMESHSVKFFFVNTDSKHLESECPTKSDIVEKFILGEQIKNGKGAGNNPVIAHDAAVDSSDYFNDIFTISDVVFLLAGFGGGTGTGISMFLTREDFLNNYQDTIVIPIVTLPFAMEGKRRAKNAAMALETVANASERLHVTPG